ncbi:MAG: hypothetical protein EZS28_054783, partial [Streblomastix strix]
MGSMASLSSSHQSQRGIKQQNSGRSLNGQSGRLKRNQSTLSNLYDPQRRSANSTQRSRNSSFNEYNDEQDQDSGYELFGEDDELPDDDSIPQYLNQQVLNLSLQASTTAQHIRQAMEQMLTLHHGVEIGPGTGTRLLVCLNNLGAIGNYRMPSEGYQQQFDSNNNNNKSSSNVNNLYLNDFERHPPTEFIRLLLSENGWPDLSS